MGKCQDCTKQAHYGYKGEKAKYCTSHKKIDMIHLYSKICEFKNCRIIPSFGYKGGKPQYCASHKLDNMIDVNHRECFIIDCNKRPHYKTLYGNLVCGDHKTSDSVNMSKKCKVNNCKIRPIYGYEDTKIGIYCKNHSLPGMINVVSKRCISEGCKELALYNIKDKSPRYCNFHRSKDMVSKGKRCKEDNCNIRPSYGYPNSKYEYCKKHALPDMINTVSTRCVWVENDERCKIRPGYNYEGNHKGLYCNKHKKEGMVNVVDKICKYIGCKYRPVFGVKGTSKPLYCSKHKDEGMVMIGCKICIEKGCGISATFGEKGTDTRLYCSKHKKDNMVSLLNKHCFENDCYKTAAFNTPGESKGLYCNTHRKLGMVDISHQKYLCQHPNCITRASFGELFRSPTHCAKHKRSNMFIKNKPTCTDCENPAYYALGDSNYPTKCEDHATNDHTNIIEKKCSNCPLTFLLGKTGMCDDCLGYATGMKHAKENRIKMLFDTNDLIYESYDQVIDSDCSKRRPDFVFDYTFFKIIVEVDENQHWSNPCECEQTRMIEIHQIFGGTPVLFIRYNPDAFKMNKVSFTKKVSQKQRENTLIKLLQTYRNINIDDIHPGLSVIYMFYDDYDEELKPYVITY